MSRWAKKFAFKAFSRSDFEDRGAKLWRKGDSISAPDKPSRRVEINEDNHPRFGEGGPREKFWHKHAPNALIEDLEARCEVGNGRNICAERIWFLKDQDSRKSALVEISQEGSNDPCYSFYNDPAGEFCTPTAGECLTVTDCSDAKPDFRDYDCLDVCKPPVDDDPVPATGEIAGTVWCDDDCDGLQDGAAVRNNVQRDPVEPDETGKAGVTVALLKVTGEPVLDASGRPIETTTDANGNYRFKDVPEGDYIVSVTAPSGFAFTEQGVGSDDSIDSDVDASGVSGVVNVSAGKTTDVDAGLKIMPVELCVEENNSFVADLDLAVDCPDKDGATVIEPDLTYSITGGADAALFRIDADTGELFFIDPPDFENPLDQGGDNFYDVIVRATAASAEPETVKINFKKDADGAELKAGDGGALLLDGVTVTANRAQDSDGAFDDVMIFDAANPTGGDDDLARPARGNILIISEDGDSSDPDDNAAGGTILFTFDEPSTVKSIRLLDTEEAGSTVELYDASGSLIRSFDVPVIRDGRTQVLDLEETADVATMRVNLSGSGAADDLIFERPGDAKFTEQTLRIEVKDDQETGFVKGRYFCDVDGDALEGPNDPAVAGRLVVLLNADGTLVRDFDGNPFSTRTEDDGSYIFMQVPEGDYRVGFEVLADKSFVMQGEDADGDGRSDNPAASDVDDTADPITVSIGSESFEVQATYVFSVAQSEIVRDVDAGVFEDIDVNDPPVAEDDAVTTGEAAPAFADLLANDDDPDGDIVTILSANGTEIGSEPFVLLEVTSVDGRTGSVAVFAEGDPLNFAFDPGSNFIDLNQGETDTVTITYTITDGNGLTDTANVIVTIEGENDAPNAEDDSVTTGEADLATANLLANDDDPNGDAVTILSANGEVLGADQFASFRLDSAGGREGFLVVTETGDLNFAFDPGSNFLDLNQDETDTLTFNYAITDGNGLTDTASVTVTVLGENDAPVAGDDEVTTGEADLATANLLANDDDPNGDPVTILSANGEVLGADQFASFRLDSAGGREGFLVVTETGDLNFAFDPGTNFLDLNQDETDTLTFDYTITDGNGLTDTASVTVTVLGENDAPDANDDAVTTGEANPVTANLLANDTDPDGDSVTILSANGVVLGAAGLAVLEATSAEGRTGTAFVGESGDVNFAFDPGSNFVDLNQGETDTVSIVYTITDGNGLTDTANVIVTIEGKNDAPDAGDDAVTTGEADLVTANLLANDDDPNGDAVTILSANGEVLGADQFASFRLDSAGGREGFLVVTETGDLNFAFDPGTNFLDLNQDETDTITFDYAITDGNGLTDTASVTVTVLGENDAPNAEDDAIVTGESAPAFADLLANDYDPNGDRVTILSANGMVIGSEPFVLLDVMSADGRSGSVAVFAEGNPLNFAFDPGTDFVDLNRGETDTVSIVYTITDGNGLTDTAEVTVIVEGQNSAPEAEDDTITTGEAAPAFADLLENDDDPDGDTVTILSANGAVIGSEPFVLLDVMSADGRSGSVAVFAEGDPLNFAFDPGTDFVDLTQGETDTVSIVYTITDGNGLTDTAEVTVIVEGENTAPEAEDDAITTSESAPAFADLLENDDDPDGDTVTILSANGTEIGSTPFVLLEVTSTGGRTGSVAVFAEGDPLNFAFDPGTDFVDLYQGETDTVTITYTITDGNGLTDTADVIVTIEGESEAGDAATVSGAIDMQGDGERDLAIIFDSSFDSFNIANTFNVADLDDDGNIGTAMDLMLSKISDLSMSLNDDDVVRLIPTGYSGPSGMPPQTTYRASEIKQAVLADEANGNLNGQNLLYNPLVASYSSLDFTIDLMRGFEAAQAAFEASSGFESSKIIAMIATESTIQPDGSTGFYGDVQGAFDDVTGPPVNADVDILVIDPLDILQFRNLETVDSDGVVDVDSDGTFSLEPLIGSPPPAVNEGELVSFEITIDGAVVASIDETDLVPNADGFDFLPTEIPAGEIDVIIELDTDGDGVGDVSRALSDELSAADRMLSADDVFDFVLNGFVGDDQILGV